LSIKIVTAVVVGDRVRSVFIIYIYTYYSIGIRINIYLPVACLPTAELTISIRSPPLPPSKPGSRPHSDTRRSCNIYYFVPYIITLSGTILRARDRHAGTLELTRPYFRRPEPENNDSRRVPQYIALRSLFCAPK